MKPWLLLPPKLAHDLSPLGLQLLAAFRDPKSFEWRSKTWRGLRFANPLGIGGGVDKDASRVEDWWTFGPGFIEVGTITPEAQTPNPGRIIDRDSSTKSVWNRMGFPGSGVLAARDNLSDLPSQRTTPIFVNIGKNRTTSNEDAAHDYIRCMKEIGTRADAFVINISSPNTTGLRDLFQPAKFRPFLTTILKERPEGTPVLLKLSPDLHDDDLANIIEISCYLGIDGFIATNTTLSREARSKYPAEGGVSGSPLADRSKEVLKKILQLLGSNRQNVLVISVGGVMTPDDVFERLELGADLVQVYSTLIFEGPYFFSRVAKRARLD